MMGREPLTPVMPMSSTMISYPGLDWFFKNGNVEIKTGTFEKKQPGSCGTYFFIEVSGQRFEGYSPSDVLNTLQTNFKF